MIEKFKIQNPMVRLRPSINSGLVPSEVEGRSPLALSIVEVPKFKIISNIKYQNPKQFICNLLFVIWILLVTCHLSLVTCYAEEITILYTGETHAMIYPCNCPIEPDGGVARRTTLVKQLRKENPNNLLLDSGGFISGGLMDEYAQNTQLDMQRAIVNLRAMSLMKYDAVAIGDDEFNFGREFLEENVVKENLAFFSCNITVGKQEGLTVSGSENKIVASPEWFKRYIIKEIAGVKIGIMGLTNLSATQKALGIEFIRPEIALKQTIEELRKNNTDIIVLLSHLGESDDLKLLKEIEGIDILIIGHARLKEGISEKFGNTLILRPSWQGRRLDKLSLILKDKKITDYKVEELRLSDKISDDQEVLSILPRCFSDANCKEEGLVGNCIDAGNINARCAFNKAAKINLSVIVPKACFTCDSEKTIVVLKTWFPGIAPTYLRYPDSRTNKLMKELEIKTLPAYLLGKEIEKEKIFDKVKEKLDIKGNFYMLKPIFAGISYFPHRKKIKGNTDIFISLYDKYTPQLLDTIKDFYPIVHFLTVQQANGEFSVAGGNLEIEDYLRAVCVQKNYPEYFYDYISCRAKSLDSSWWEDCLGGLDIGKIRICAKGDEGKSLLKANISLNKEIEAMFGPTYLVDNQEIFSTQGGVPTKEEFKKLFNRK